MRWKFVSLLLTLWYLRHSVSGQRLQKCEIKTSNANNKKIDVHCNCMQQLAVWHQPIDQLTIDQRACSNSALELDWVQLEGLVTPRVFSLRGASVMFAANTTHNLSTKSSLTQIYFQECHFVDIPSGAFKSLKTLQEIRFVNTTIDKISSWAFGGHRHLKTVEFADCTIGHVLGNAFTQLTAIHDLAFVFSNITSFAKDAISIMNVNESKSVCSMDDPQARNHILNNIMTPMGRHLESTGNLTLPEFGARLLLYHSRISIMQTQSLHSNAFAFLIIGSSFIEVLESQAWHLELHNDCEISATILVGNHFGNVSRQALASVRGRSGSPHKTFLAMSKNRFQTVQSEGFLLSENLVLFAVEENWFECQCHNFDWVFSRDTEVQKELENQLLNKGNCIEGGNLLEFINHTCLDSSNSSSHFDAGGWKGSNNTTFNKAGICTTTSLFSVFLTLFIAFLIM